MLRRAASSLQLSMRAHQRLLRVARTLADLEGSTEVSETHLAEAIRYRGG
jgi:magnesium chelatase family protein